VPARAKPVADSRAYKLRRPPASRATRRKTCANSEQFDYVRGGRRLVRGGDDPRHYGDLFRRRHPELMNRYGRRVQPASSLHRFSRSRVAKGGDGVGAVRRKTVRPIRQQTVHAHRGTLWAKFHFIGDGCGRVQVRPRAVTAGAQALSTRRYWGPRKTGFSGALVRGGVCTWTGLHTTRSRLAYRDRRRPSGVEPFGVSRVDRTFNDRGRGLTAWLTQRRRPGPSTHPPAAGCRSVALKGGPGHETIWWSKGSRGGFVGRITDVHRGFVQAPCRRGCGQWVSDGSRQAPRIMLWLDDPPDVAATDSNPD